MQAILTSSNLAVLALCVAGVAKDWNQSAFQLFLNTKLKQVWPFLLVYPAFLLVMPLLPRPKKVANETADKPSIGEAKFMALVTLLIDYFVVGALLLFWDSIGRLEDGSLCPFTAAGTLLVGVAVMSVKDEIQCRFLWRKFISPYKLNSWPYSWHRSFDHISTSASFLFLGALGLFLSGFVSCESIKNPKVLLQVLLESTLVSEVFAHIFMIFGHKWMHEKAYFLHKKHHKASNKCLMAFGTMAFDLLDMVIEFGGGVPCLIVVKRMFFGSTSKVHFLIFGFGMLKGIQDHSGNPYALHFFVPVLDNLIRTTLCHNLHHVVQSDYLSGKPGDHLFRPETRRKDIDLYNKHLKTQFPRSL